MSNNTYYIYYLYKTVLKSVLKSKLENILLSQAIALTWISLTYCIIFP